MRDILYRHIYFQIFCHLLLVEAANMELGYRGLTHMNYREEKQGLGDTHKLNIIV